MRELPPSVPSAPPPLRTLLWTTALALVSAAVVVVGVVLPAEYGVDPLGTGAALGLTAIGAPDDGVIVPEAPAEDRLQPVQDGPVSHYGRGYKVDARELVLGPYEYVEFKYRLEAGATMLYSWTADTELVHEFHADPDGNPPPEPLSFDRRDRRQASGSFTAPVAGIHGWYWENPSNETVTVSLVTAGFYSSAVEMQSNRRRVVREVREPEGPASAVEE